MKIVTVIPLKKGIFKEDLTYFTTKDIPVGSIVTVSIRTKKVLGLVSFTEDVTKIKINIKDMNFNLKKIIEVKEHSIFRTEYLESALEMSRYFLTNKNNTITSLIPSIFREKYDIISMIERAQNNPQIANNKELKNEKLLFQAPLEDRITSYKTLIRESFASKKSVFIVLPTEQDIKNFGQVLSRGIEKFTFAIYGTLTSKKSMEKIDGLLRTDHPILILGTAPYLALPRNDIATIILEHESSSSYKTFSKPNIDLRVFVEIYASRINAKLILSDTLLRFETIARGDKSNEVGSIAPLSPITFRINFDGEIKTLNKNNGSDEKFKILEDESIQEIENNLAHKKSVFIFSLRKGLATTTVCNDCGTTVNCEKCLAPVVLYLSKDGKKRIFSCNRCKREIDPETKCTNCNSWNLTPLGIGTDTVYEEVKRIFGKDNHAEGRARNIKIFKIDKESAKNKEGAEKIIAEFEENPGSILIGTEMALFYLKNKIALSIIASFNSLWSIPNYKISEKVIQILASIISRTNDKLLIQTINDQDEAILAFKNNNLLSFIRTELKEREDLGYPPYRRFIKISFLGDKTETEEVRKFLKENLKEYNPEIFSGFVERLKGKYATNVLLRLDIKDWSLKELTPNSNINEKLYAKLSTLPKEFNITVDPEDLL